MLEPGADILQLVPVDTDLILTTRVAPTDIDEVVAGGPVRVQLTAYSYRSTPPIQGTVVMVAADSLTDVASGQPYYRVDIRIDSEALASLPNVKTLPGMPAQAMIETGHHTIADYLISPVFSNMSRAMKESNS